MLGMLVARAEGGEGVTKEEQKQAQEALARIERHGDKATIDALRKVKSEGPLSTATGKMRGALSGFLRTYEGIDWKKGGGELMQHLVEQDVAAQGGEGGKASSIYGVNYAEAQARTLQGIKADLKTAKDKLQGDKEVKDEKDLLKKQIDLADYVKSIADVWLQAGQAFVPTR